MPVIRVSAALITDDAGLALMVRKHGTSAFMQPGGKPEPGESAADCLSRELAEELGAVVPAADLEYVGLFRSEAANEPGHALEAEVFRAHVRGPFAVAAEIAELRWVDPHDWGDLHVAPLSAEHLLPLLAEQRPRDVLPEEHSSPVDEDGRADADAHPSVDQPERADALSPAPADSPAAAAHVPATSDAAASSTGASATPLPRALPVDPERIVWSTPDHEAALSAGASLVVLLHGYGSHERDLAGLTPYLPAGAVTAALRAPLPAGPGFAWFPLAEPGVPDADAVTASALGVLDWLDVLGATGPVVPLGFSQGGAMALQLLRLAPRRFAGAVNLSGFAVGGSLEGDAVLAERTVPVFWGRDEADPVIAPVAIERTNAWLPRHALVTRELYPGIAHGISREELDDVHAFLAPLLAR